MLRRALTVRLSMKDVMPQRAGYCPVVNAVREGEQIDEC
jgi:hypothetical protein